MPKATPPTQWAGFTMIELLIVLGAIGLLIGVMLPVMGRMRHEARVTTCVNNAGAIARAFGTYLSDHNEIYPTSANLGNRLELAGWNLMGKQGNQNRWQPGGTPVELRPLNPYLESVELAHCPLDMGTQNIRRNTLYERFGSSYYYDDRRPGDVRRQRYGVQWGVWFIEGHHQSQVKHPDKKLLVSDAIRRLDLEANDARNLWHSAGEPLEISIAFADGHAANMGRKLGTGPGEPAEYAEAQFWQRLTPQQLQKIDNWAQHTSYY